MKIALVENFGADFVGARLRFAVYLQNKGIDVTAVIPEDGHKEIIEEQGIKVLEVGVNVRKKDLATTIDFAKKLRAILRAGNYDIVHFYRLQPNIIGTIVASLFTKAKVVNHVTGLGVVFANNSSKNKILQVIIRTMYRFNSFFFNPYTIFQNKEDILDLNVKKQTICIEGSAVNEDRFNKNYANENSLKIDQLRNDLGIPKGERVFIFVSRLLREKGLLELVEAFVSLNEKRKETINLLIVGWSDLENPSAVKPEDLKEMVAPYSFIKFLGKRFDVNDLLALSHASILPTYYREGTPRFMLESMAMSKPIITTNMPGCNHLVDNGKNGILIEPKEVKEIENAVEKLLDSNLDKMGEQGNRLYFEKFSEKVVYSSIEKLYNSILEK